MQVIFLTWLKLCTSYSSEKNFKCRNVNISQQVQSLKKFFKKNCWCKTPWSLHNLSMKDIYCIFFGTNDRFNLYILLVILGKIRYILIFRPAIVLFMFLFWQWIFLKMHIACLTYTVRAILSISSRFPYSCRTVQLVCYSS